MVLFLGRNEKQREAFVISLRRTVSESVALRRAKVQRGTYAGDLVSRFYDSLFRRSLELKSDYVKYFAGEYSTFDTYLRRQFLWAPEVTNQVTAVFDRSQAIFYFEPTYSFIDEEYGQSFIERVLGRNVTE